MLRIQASYTEYFIHNLVIYHIRQVGEWGLIRHPKIMTTTALEITPLRDPKVNHIHSKH